MKHCEADGGHLFVSSGTRMECVASVGEIVSTVELEGFVESVRSMDAALNIGVTATDLGLDDAVTARGRWTSETGATYDSIPLYAVGDGDDDAAVGIAVLHPRTDKVRRPAAEFMRALVRTLTDVGDLPNKSLTT
jgi:hypothetical protein